MPAPSVRQICLQLETPDELLLVRSGELVAGSGDVRRLAFAGFSNTAEPVEIVSAEEVAFARLVDLAGEGIGIDLNLSSVRLEPVSTRSLEHPYRESSEVGADALSDGTPSVVDRPVLAAANRETNIHRFGWLAAEIADDGGVRCSPIAPYDSTARGCAPSSTSGVTDSGRYTLRPPSRSASTAIVSGVTPGPRPVRFGTSVASACRTKSQTKQS